MRKRHHTNANNSDLAHNIVVVKSGKLASTFILRFVFVTYVQCELALITFP